MVEGGSSSSSAAPTAAAPAPTLLQDKDDKPKEKASKLTKGSFVDLQSAMALAAERKKKAGEAEEKAAKHADA